MERCGDCKALKPLADIRQWLWWDFYAAQGDEALNICVDCWGGPAHVRRMANDDRAYEEEMGHPKPRVRSQRRTLETA